MKLIFLSVIGLVAAIESELGLEGLKPSELREIEKEIAAGNVPPNYTLEKPKRGLAKVSNTDSPTFNHLSNSAKPAYTTTQQTSYSVQPSYTPVQQQQAYVQPEAATAYNPAASAAYNPGVAAGQQAYTPLRYVYNNQYFPANQYLQYLQNPQLASQIAAQYSYQPHYLQTPTQIQYVSSPNYAGVPAAQYKALTAKAASASQTQTSTTSSANQASSQVVLPSNMAPAPIQYQQPLLMYIIPSPQQAVPQQYYQPQQQMLLLGGANPLLGLYNGQHRFALPYTSPLANQLTYLSPAAAQVQAQQQYQSLQPVSQSADSSSKQAINVQETSSSQSFGVRTKA